MPLEELAFDFAYSESGFADIQWEIALKQLVKGLPDDLQEIVLLRFGQDLTMREIARIVDMPMRTVQSRLRAALKKLRETWGDGGE